MSLEFRPPRDRAEALAFMSFAGPALLAPRSGAEAFLDREGQGPLRLLLENGRIVAGLSMRSMAQYFGGRAVPSLAFRMVAVEPGARGRGIAGALLRAALEEGKAAHPIAMLYPATVGFYRNLGFEEAGHYMRAELPTREFPDGRSARAAVRELPVCEVPLDHPALRAIYEADAARSAGAFVRDAWLWNRLLRPIVPGPDRIAYLFGPASAPEGYLITAFEHQSGGRHGTLLVKDRAFLTARAVQRAQIFLCHHASTLSRVRLEGGVADALLSGLANHTFEIPYAERWMLRLTDPGRALALRGYSAAVRAEVHLTIVDPGFEPDATRLILTVEGGQARTAPGGRGDVVVDARGLAALYTGFASPSDVRLQGYTDDADALAGVFAGPTPALRDFV